MTRETSEQRAALDFPENIAKHVMQVHLDNGVYRHIECGEPGTFNRRFYVTTWPGALCISGGMGTFVFERLRDMFEFFRTDRGRVNLSYWSEKIVATNNRAGNGHQEYSPDMFRECIAERLNEWVDSNSDDFGTVELQEIRDRVDDEVLSLADNGEYAAHVAARNFEVNRREVFTDFWETRLREYTYHFAWCCHAIVWAIQQWDARAEEQAAIAALPVEVV